MKISSFYYLQECTEFDTSKSMINGQGSFE